MANQKTLKVDSPIGRVEPDSIGSPVGVARVDAQKSYAGTGKLLQDYINNASQEAWDKIKKKIDYTYKNLDWALAPLEEKTKFGFELNHRLEKGQKLLFKPNLVIPNNIDPQTHGPTSMSTSCTEWPFIAALMRWFNEKLGISYYQMALGEAATAMPAMAGFYTMLCQKENPITPEAVLEGKSGNFYGGWGFYFVRKYLSESRGNDSTDNPMNGFEESVSGTYIPPGQVTDKLMIYDLNRISDNPDKGREIIVPAGINYKTIMLHKAIIGGDPSNSEDMKAYPGSILINVPKFKVHAIALFTNIIKNLGIGLYPMQYSKQGGHHWDYSVPYKPVPGMKSGIPHLVWDPEIDPQTGLPRKDKTGKYIVNKTGGITATMIDIIKAVSHQNIFMMHIVDGIEAINIDHTGSPMAERVPEGMIFAGVDPVAADLLCARYMFSNVPIDEALQSGLDDGTGGFFPQKVPVPTVEGSNIISHPGFDCPLSRDICFRKAEERGLGKRQYHASGWDGVKNAPIVSIQGHLGSVTDGTFTDLVTDTLYFDMYKMPWDMQKTTFSYMESVDKLEGTSLKKIFLDAFDEDGDGVVTYEEFGKNGSWGGYLQLGGEMVSKMADDKSGPLRSILSRSTFLRNSDPSMNREGNDIFKEMFLGFSIFSAYRISQVEIEGPDPFHSGLTWGKGKWPSSQLARFFQIGSFLYGQTYPSKVSFPSLYGAAFFYADYTQNESKYTGNILSEPNPEALDQYVSEVLSGKQKPLDFTFYVQAGYDNLSGNEMPNVESTDDPGKVFTVSFDGGKEIWPQRE